MDDRDETIKNLTEDVEEAGKILNELQMGILESKNSCLKIYERRKKTSIKDIFFYIVTLLSWLVLSSFLFKAVLSLEVSMFSLVVFIYILAMSYIVGRELVREVIDYKYAVKNVKEIKSEIDLFVKKCS
jgi:divalent metal cation (Fe/Co/Zn/Cd) transporter